MGKRPSADVRRRQDAIKSWLWQEIDKSEIVDAIIASNLPGGGAQAGAATYTGPPLHRPDPPRQGKAPLTVRELQLAAGRVVMPAATPEEEKRAAQFRESVRKTVNNDITEIASRLSAKRAMMLPIAAEIFEEQQADLYKTGRKRFNDRNADPKLAAAAGEIAMKASVNIATVRKVDVKGTRKIEVEIGEKLARASRARIAEKWRQIRAQQPTIPNKPSLLIVDVKAEQPSQKKPDPEGGGGDGPAN